MTGGSLFQGVLCTVLLAAISVGGVRADGQKEIERMVGTMVGTSSGSELLVSVQDFGATSIPSVFAFSVSTGDLLWRGDASWQITATAISPDGKVVALGLDRALHSDVVAVLVDALSGKMLSAIQHKAASNFLPNEVKALAFAPDSSWFYGLTEDGLFAWDVRTARLLWTHAVPGGDPVFRGDAPNSFALSADGNRLALNRSGMVYVLRVGRIEPHEATKLPVGGRQYF